MQKIVTLFITLLFCFDVIEAKIGKHDIAFSSIIMKDMPVNFADAIAAFNSKLIWSMRNNGNADYTKTIKQIPEHVPADAGNNTPENEANAKQRLVTADMLEKMNETEISKLAVIPLEIDDTLTVDSTNTGRDPVMNLLIRLFPSNGGDINIVTGYHRNLWNNLKLLTPSAAAKVMAKFLGICKQVREGKYGIPSQVEIDQFIRLMISSSFSKDTQDINSKQITTFIDVFLEIAELIRESVRFEMEISLYPGYMTETILMAFCCEAFNGIDGVLVLLQAFISEGLIHFDPWSSDFREYMHNFGINLDYCPPQVNYSLFFENGDAEESGLQPFIQCIDDDKFIADSKYDALLNEMNKLQILDEGFRQVSMFISDFDEIMKQVEEEVDSQTKNYDKKKDINKINGEKHKVFLNIVSKTPYGTFLTKQQLGPLKTWYESKRKEPVTTQCPLISLGTTLYDFSEIIRGMPNIRSIVEDISFQKLKNIMSEYANNPDHAMMTLKSEIVKRWLYIFFKNYEQNFLKYQTKIRSTIDSQKSVKEVISLEQFLIISDQKGFVPYSPSEGFEQNMGVEVKVIENGVETGEILRFQDCVETTLRHLVTMACDYDEKKDVVITPNNFNKKLIDFFKKYPKKEFFNNKNNSVHNEFASILSELTDVKREKGGDLDANTDNILKGIGFLVGISAAKVNELYEKSKQNFEETLQNILNIYGRQDVTWKIEKNDKSNKNTRLSNVNISRKDNAEDKIQFVLKIIVGHHACLEHENAANGLDFRFIKVDDSEIGAILAFFLIQNNDWNLGRGEYYPLSNRHKTKIKNGYYEYISKGTQSSDGRDSRLKYEIPSSCTTDLYRMDTAKNVALSKKIKGLRKFLEICLLEKEEQQKRIDEFNVLVAERKQNLELLKTKSKTIKQVTNAWNEYIQKEDDYLKYKTKGNLEITNSTLDLNDNSISAFFIINNNDASLFSEFFHKNKKNFEPILRNVNLGNRGIRNASNNYIIPLVTYLVHDKNTSDQFECDINTTKTLHDFTIDASNLNFKLSLFCKFGPNSVIKFSNRKGKCCVQEKITHPRYSNATTNGITYNFFFSEPIDKNKGSQVNLFDLMKRSVIKLYVTFFEHR